MQLTINGGFSKTDGIDQNYNDMGLDTMVSSSKYMYEEQGFMSISVEKGDIYSSISIDRNHNIRPIVFPPYISSIYEGNTDFIAMRYILGYNHKFSDKFQLNTSYQYQYQEEELRLDFVGLDNDQIIQNSTVDAHEFDINGKYDVNKN